MANDRRELVERILQLETALYRAIRLVTPSEWLHSDLTMPQLKILILLFIDGPTRMTFVASNMGISLATTTGIIDRLVERRLVVREGLPGDRRVVMCRLSEEGLASLSQLREIGQTRMRQLLSALSDEQLAIVTEAMEIMLSEAPNLANESSERRTRYAG